MKYLYKYPYVKIVHGIRNSIIFNLINGDIFNIELQFIPIVKLIKTHSIAQLVKKYDKIIISQFIAFIVQNKLGILMEQRNFPKITKVIPNYKYNQLEIAEIELSSFTIKNFNNIYRKLNSLKCHTYFFILNDDFINDYFEFLNGINISFNLVIN